MASKTLTPPQSPPSAQALIDHLSATGTSPERVEIAKAFLTTNPDSSAEDVYRHLESVGVKEGTLRKAGRFVFGKWFEPESAVIQAPEEELTKARERAENVTQELAEKRALVLSQDRQIENLERKIVDLTGQVDILQRKLNVPTKPAPAGISKEG